MKASTELAPGPSKVTHKRFYVSFVRAFVFLAIPSVSATMASQILPHIERGDLPAFLCTSAILLNTSAALSTVTLTAMKIELDLRLSRMQGFGRTARFLYLNWIVCTLGGMACLIAVLLPYVKQWIHEFLYKNHVTFSF